MKKLVYSLLLVSGTIMMVSCGGKDKKDDNADDMEDLTMNEGSVFQFASYTPADSARTFGKKITADGANNVYNVAADKAKGKMVLLVKYQVKLPAYARPKDVG
ncbi:MAG: hypothetical protein IPO03_03420 [Bacteroidetes bacterium]|nr:hypothetical protein [Bacteroidota bacterium]